MGHGKKNKTFPMKKIDVSWTVNSSPTARNLPKNELGAVIFGCKHHTYSECLNKQIFGLPAAHYSYVKNVTPGLTLFLFNYSDRKLYGVFEAVSSGQMNMDQYAWITCEGAEITPYAAQVRVDFRRKCRPLLEEEFKPIIAKNYYAERLFWFELDKGQTNRLVKLFLSSPLPEKMPLPPKAAKWNNMFDVLSSSDVNVAADDEEFNNQDSEEDPGMAEMKLEENEHSSASVLFNRDAFAREKKWTELFKISSSSHTVKNGEDLESHEVRSNLSVPGRFDAEWKFDSYSNEVSKLPLEACSDVASVECDTNIVECWEVLVDDDGKEIYESNASLLQYHDCDRLDLTDTPSSENGTFLKGEGGELEPFEFESVVAKAPEETSINSKENVHAFVANDAKEIYENKVSFLQHHELECVRPDLTGVPSSENGTFLDREGVELKTVEFQSVVTKGAEVVLISTKENVRSGNVLAPIEKCQRKQNQSNLTDKAFLENSNSMSEGVLTDMQSSDFESVIIKLMQEIEGLKVSQLKQRLKTDSLEYELVHSKLEIDQLKKRCHKLESKPSSSSDHYSVEDCESSSEESVLIVGGSDGNSWLPDLSLYSPLQDLVVSLCPMTFSRSYASVAKLNGELYVFGGVLDGVWYDTVESYNPIINQWVQRPYLNQRRGSMAGASAHEKIFAIGGGNGVDCFSEVEFLDLNIGSWMFTQSMLVKRNAPAAADMNGAVYVAGGYDGNEYLRSAERFDPRTHAWTSLANMNSKRGCHSLVPFKEKLYALGGYDGEKMVSTVEVFDPRVGLWMMDEPMTVSRGYFGSFVCGGKIYVIGGMKDGDVLDVIECYEEGCGWQITGNTSLGKRCFFSALVL